ncbi:MAG: dockerin type I repeat-containing protein, partial [Clostridia bacterium]|nr:dockerin type I repeat-containing protein [Clostridia bacterium]
YGDVNGDGKDDAADALEVLKSVVGKVKLTDAQLLAGDVNGDKAVNAQDALLILQKVVGKLPAYPVEI